MRQDILIRSYIEEDEAEVIRLWREVFPDSPFWNDPATDIHKKLEIQRDMFIVALENEKLVGTAMAGYDGHRGWVYYVAVNPKSQMRGIGRALVLEVEERLIAIGCHKLNLQVRAGDTSVIEFYERIGYNVEERVSMSKRLV